jgi:hypothetical protein
MRSLREFEDFRVGRVERSGVGELAVAALVVALAGCATVHHQYLAALKDDPMATVSLPGATLERRSEVDAEAGGFMSSKRSLAKVLLLFRINDPARADAVAAAVVRMAEENGWTVTSAHEDDMSLSKDLSTGRAELSVAFMLGSDKRELVVNMVHGWPNP